MDDTIVTPITLGDVQRVLARWLPDGASADDQGRPA